MRWQVPLSLVLLVLPALLAGCTAPREDLDDDIPVTLGPDQAYVRIYVKRPLDAELYPLWSLTAVPRVVAFLGSEADINTTDPNATITADYADVAAGWPSDWNATADGRAYPEAAEKNWLRPQGIWFEGAIPAGNYSTIRIEIIGVQATDQAGRTLSVGLMANRLSIGPMQGPHFEVPAGKAHTFVFESAMERTGDTTYLIR